jgi:hypothetical protein
MLQGMKDGGNACEDAIRGGCNGHCEFELTAM